MVLQFLLKKFSCAVAFGEVFCYNVNNVKLKPKIKKVQVCVNFSVC